MNVKENKKDKVLLFKKLLVITLFLTIVAVFLNINTIIVIGVISVFSTYQVGGLVFASDEMEFHEDHHYFRWWVWCYIWWPLFTTPKRLKG